MEPLIVSTPDVLFGAPRLAGTRISVALVRDEIASGTSASDVCSAYGLTPEQVAAALEFAAATEKRHGDQSTE